MNSALPRQSTLRGPSAYITSHRERTSQDSGSRGARRVGTRTTPPSLRESTRQGAHGSRLGIHHFISNGSGVQQHTEAVTPAIPTQPTPVPAHTHATPRGFTAEPQGEKQIAPVLLLGKGRAEARRRPLGQDMVQRRLAAVTGSATPQLFPAGDRVPRFPTLAHLRHRQPHSTAGPRETGSGLRLLPRPGTMY